jgi:hypothetical protein
MYRREGRGGGEMNGGVGIEYSLFNSLYLSEIIVKRYLACASSRPYTYTQQHVYTPLTSTTMTSIQPRGAHTIGSRSSRDMVEFLTSEPPFTDQDTETGTRPSQEHRPFYGKRERRSGGCVQRWNNFWGPSRPDPWLSRKFAVGYVANSSLKTS